MLPSAFIVRMRSLLGEEAERFFAALEEDAPVRSFRVNTEKIDVPSFCAIAKDVSFSPIAHTDDGFYTDTEHIGATPYHHAGMLYMQDPSAMATVQAVKQASPLRILDACAAPGGKTGQLCALTHNGIVFSNEYVPSRAKILQGNIERMGYHNATVTQWDTAVYTEHFADYFDLVVADAPCSGEGMFRKNELARNEWSEENVSLCANRQKEILQNLAPCVKANGHLLYSTCTFSCEENEQIVSWFLQTHPEFSLCPVAKELCARTDDGIAINDTCDFSLCRRFYPHKERGEGQFIALFVKNGSQQSAAPAQSKKKSRTQKPSPYAVTKQEAALLEDFLHQTLTQVPQGQWLKIGELFFLAPTAIEPQRLPAFGILSCGVAVGSIRGQRVVPHHQFFSAYGSSFVRTLSLPCDSPLLSAYLRGEEIACSDIDNGWCAILADGVALGGGKVVGSVLKNHYPKGLRNP